MAVTEGTRRIVGGVDTHKGLHVAAVVDEQDRVMETRSFATTCQGYRQLPRFISSRPTPRVHIAASNALLIADRASEVKTPCSA